MTRRRSGRASGGEAGHRGQRDGWILRSEDYSLLMGSLLLFGVLATLMIATRRIDWSNVVKLQRDADA